MASAPRRRVAGVDFEIAIRKYGDPDVAQMVDEVQAEYVLRYGGPDLAVVDPDEFSPPNGVFLVGLLDGDPVATGGWRRLGDGEGEGEGEGQGDAEIKRMYVAARARRRGLARRVLTELERTATNAGVTRLILNTGPEQPEAVALYEEAGYLPIAGFGHYACHPHALFFGKDLSPGRTRR
jgi:GNAT superfamily N-acetyltransferase